MENTTTTWAVGEPPKYMSMAQTEKLLCYLEDVQEIDNLPEVLELMAWPEHKKIEIISCKIPPNLWPSSEQVDSITEETMKASILRRKIKSILIPEVLEFLDARYALKK